MLYIISRNVIHLDLRCANVLLQNVNGFIIAKVADLGCSVHVDKLLSMKADPEWNSVDVKFPKPFKYRKPAKFLHKQMETYAVYASFL